MNIDILKQVRTIVVHQNSPTNPCPDGTASAIILQDALPRARVHFAAHGHSSLDDLPAEEGMLFCDITPPPMRVREFVEAGAVVLDHHEKHRATTLLFGERAVYSEQRGFSGAMLAFTHVWCAMHPTSGSCYDDARDFAALAGVRDTWWKDHPAWTRSCEQAEALRFWPWEEWPADPFGYSGGAFKSMLDIGRVLLRKKQVRDQQLATNALILHTKRGTRIAVVPTTETSDVAELVDADALVGFKYRHDPASRDVLMLVLSMRSRAGYDVGALAKSLGGGGHKFAAGAQVVPLDVNPYQRIINVFDLHEQADVTQAARELDDALEEMAARRNGEISANQDPVWTERAVRARDLLRLIIGRPAFSWGDDPSQRVLMLGETDDARR